jgi:hypothetical protein
MQMRWIVVFWGSLSCIFSSVGCCNSDQFFDKKPDASTPTRRKKRRPRPAPSAIPAPDLQPNKPKLTTTQPRPNPGNWATTRGFAIPGSYHLNCTSKLFGQWYRVSCKGSNVHGSRPMAIHIVRSNLDDVFAGSGEDGVGGRESTLILPYVDGAFIETVFAWSDKRMVFQLHWPKGTRKQARPGMFRPEPATGTEGGSCPGPTSCKPGLKCCIGLTIPGWCLPACDTALESTLCTTKADCPVVHGSQQNCLSHAGRLLCR